MVIITDKMQDATHKKKRDITHKKQSKTHRQT